MSPRSRSNTRTAWTYLGLAMAPTMIIALPTAETAHGGMRVRNIEIRYPAGESRNGTSPFPPPPPPPPPKNDHDSDDDDESDDDDVVASASISAGIPLQTGIPEAEAAAMRVQSPEEETKEHWMIAMGSVVSFVVICAVCFLLWKWRAVIAKKIFPNRGNNRNSFSSTAEKSRPIITGPTDGWQSVGSDAPASLYHIPLFGAPTTESGTTEDGIFAMPYPPAPALAPSTAQMGRQGSLRRLVRRSLLDESDRQRIASPTSDGHTHTFYLENELAAGTTAARKSIPTRKTKRESLSLNIAPAAATAFPPAPAIPDSPEAAREISRFSWITAAKSVRSSVSMESQPVKHRTVNSWVSQQANRTMLKNDATTAQVPPTPVEFRAHPGAEVVFGSGGRRIESRVLDMRLDARS